MTDARTQARRLRVYEHGRLSTGALSESELAALERWNEGQAARAFTRTHKQLTFNQWVGVLQVGRTAIEVLPKLDRTLGPAAEEGSADEQQRAVCHANLLRMLQRAGWLPMRLSNDAGQRLQHMDLLALFELRLLEEVEAALQRGVVKRYRPLRASRGYLKGRWLLSQQLAQTAGPARPVFFTEATAYDPHHLSNALVASALERLAAAGSQQAIRGRARHLAGYWPAAPVRPPVLARHFERLPTGRKMAPYAELLPLVRFILLRLVPDFTPGQTPVVALLFDMNRLFEAYLRAELRRSARQQGLPLKVGATRDRFWTPSTAGVQPKALQTDIVLEWQDDSGRKVVLDAKWKLPKGRHELPVDAELKQMFAYQHIFDASEAFLLYPAGYQAAADNFDGRFGETGLHCGYRFLPLLERERLSERWAADLLKELAADGSAGPLP